MLVTRTLPPLTAWAKPCECCGSGRHACMQQDGHAFGCVWRGIVCLAMTSSPAGKCRRCACIVGAFGAAKSLQVFVAPFAVGELGLFALQVRCPLLQGSWLSGILPCHSPAAIARACSASLHDAVLSSPRILCLLIPADHKPGQRWVHAGAGECGGAVGGAASAAPFGHFSVSGGHPSAGRRALTAPARHPAGSCAELEVRPVLAS